jgi:DNA-binding TFAR19-related protein (PDSD5 family)
MENIFIEFKKLADIKGEIKDPDLIDLMKKFDIKLKT